MPLGAAQTRRAGLGPRPLIAKPTPFATTTNDATALADGIGDASGVFEAIAAIIGFAAGVGAASGTAEITAMTPEQLRALQLAIDLLLNIANPSASRGPAPFELLRTQLREARINIG